jgi:8-amino-7-oxononanoate synthase
MLAHQARWQASLAAKKQQSLYRAPRIHQAMQGPLLHVDGRECLSFCSNDYLGLAAHSQLIEAVQSGAARYGAGSGSAHLIAGHSTAHQAFEEAFAAFVGAQRALLFSTGYLANLAMAQWLTQEGVLLQDKLNHASLIDAARLSDAQFKRFPHNDVHAMEKRLIAEQGREVLVMVDGVFSMDGDLAPIAEQNRLCETHGAMLYVDDAHGFGLLGESGRGSYSSAGLAPKGERILMATLGKSAGIAGAVIAADAWVIESLIQAARSYIFTTAMPPAIAHAGLTSLALIAGEEGDARRAALYENIAVFRRLAVQADLALMPSATAIQPVLMGSSEKALRVSQSLWQAGIWVPAIRPPTVKPGSERLRVSLSASHTTEQIERLVQALAQAIKEAE